MQDRFKFRTWDNRYKKYRNGLAIYNNTVCTYDDNDCILDQCTGLKDKNGKLIYEGDIVKETDLYERKKLVKWLDCQCGFNISTTYNYNDGKCSIGGYVELEVIGNIHENADLLENKDE